MENSHNIILNGNGHHSKGPKAQVNPKQVFFKYFRHWPWILLSLMVCLALAFAFLRYTPKQFRVSTTIMIKGDTDSEGLAESKIMQELGIVENEVDVRNELLILKSRDLMTKVISRLGFDVMYFTQGKIQKSELYRSPLKVATYELSSAAYGKSFQVNILDENQFQLSEGENSTTQEFGSEFQFAPYGKFSFVHSGGPDPNFKDYLISFYTPGQIGAEFSRKLSIQNVAGNKEVLLLSMVDPVPEKARDILQTLVNEYDQASLDERNKVYNNQKFFIEERLQDMTKELNQVEESAERIRINSVGIMDNLESGSSDMIAEITEYERQIVEIEIQEKVISAIKDSLQSSQWAYVFFPPSLNIEQDFTLPNLLTQYNELLAQREQLLISGKSKNPVIEKLDIQILNLRQTVLTNLEVFQKSLTDTKARIVDHNGQLQGRVRSLPTKKRRFSCPTA